MSKCSCPNCDNEAEMFSECKTPAGVRFYLFWCHAHRKESEAPFLRRYFGSAIGKLAGIKEAERG